MLSLVLTSWALKDEGRGIKTWFIKFLKPHVALGTLLSSLEMNLTN